MTRYAGLDGIRGAWVLVWIEGGKRGFERLDDIAHLFDKPFARAAIDIPIGIPDSGNRGCDLAAKQMLGKNHNRVFTGVLRWMLDMPMAEREHYFAINRAAQAKGEKRISLQMFGILPKIRDVDRAMTPARQTQLIECHPELVFQRLNGGRAVPGKKTAQGHALRRDLLLADGFDALDDWLAARRGTGIKPDDLLDACACAIAARDRVARLSGRTDPRGLRMEINS